MSSLPSQLSQRIEAVAGVDPELRPATKPQFGHFQSNVALRLAKLEGAKPRDVAQRIVGQLQLDDLCETPEVAGPGFINFRIRADVLAATVTAQLADPRAGIAEVALIPGLLRVRPGNVFARFRNITETMPREFAFRKGAAQRDLAIADRDDLPITMPGAVFDIDLLTDLKRIRTKYHNR